MAKRVRKVRGAMSLQVASLALGCSTSKLWYVEHGTQRPSLADLGGWCKATGIDAEIFYPELFKLAVHFGPKLVAKVAQVGG